MSAKVYVEGGGDSRDLNALCREAFVKLLEKAGLAGRMPSIVPCGPREKAYDMFKTEMEDNDAVAILLVDSEDPVAGDAWDHLLALDGWARPPRVADDQAQLMATCMETWLMADRAALRAFFRDCLQETALFPSAPSLEHRTRQDVQARLERATRRCGRDRSYTKGKRSFQLLAEIDPQPLRVLPHFQRFLNALDNYL